MNKLRDLKADLEMCNKATPGPWVKDERGGCVAVYPRSIGEINCMGESEGKRIFYKGGYKVLDKDGRFKHWEVYPQDIADAEFVAQAREGWPYAIERALKAEADFKRQEEYSDMLEDERNELYNLARELVDTLNVAQQSLHENGIGIVDDRDVMNKVREVLGGES